MGEKGYKTGFHPMRALSGYRIVRLDRTALEAFLNMLNAGGISYGGIVIDEDTAMLRLPFFGFSALCRKATERGIVLNEISAHGLPALALRYKMRLGVPLGLAIGLVLVILSQTLIWDVRVDGAGRLSDNDVKQVLEECGLSVGKWKSRLDIDVIENRVLIMSDDISWISVNIVGTVAKVEIRELDFAPEENESLPPAANIVAEQGGIIVALEDTHGELAVDVGDSVGEGQLLIGGVVGDELRGFRYLCAQGRVLASVECELETVITRKYQKKQYTGKEKCEKYLIFFENEIKFFTNSGNLYPLYDKIDTVEYLRAPNGDRLPVGIRTVRYLEYEYVEETRSDQQLKQLADYKMSLLIDALDGEILKRGDDYSRDTEGCRLVCRLTVIKDIAKMQEIDID